MSAIAFDDAVLWLSRPLPLKPALILTDPPHLDRYPDAEAHLSFTKRWLPAALAFGCPVVHSCGTTAPELASYHMVSAPDRVHLWTDGVAQHFYFFHNYPLFLDWLPQGGISRVGKPDPWYKTIIHHIARSGTLVVDPFCGRGEIPAAARESGCLWAGCDTNAAVVDYCRGRGL